MSALDSGIIEGPAYMHDARHVLLTVRFTGATRGSRFDGPQVIAIRTDGGHFSNGDAWKCVTCGIPADNRQGANMLHERGPNGAPLPPSPYLEIDHPQAFPGDRKMLAGTNIIDCGPHQLTDDACTPEQLHVFPIHWTMSADGSGPGGSMRELRLHPDGEHLIWNHFLIGPKFDQYGFTGRLAFNPNPSAGEPRVPRYELEKVNMLVNFKDLRFVAFRSDPKDASRLIENPPMGQVGEARGWSRDGKHLVGMGLPESGNVDLFLTDLTTGRSDRITRDPAYADPIMMSPDDKWFVAMDNRLTDRHLYFSAMQGIPPLMELVTVRVPTNDDYGYRNGLRRFFQPILIDRAGDRGAYRGQQLNAGNGAPGSPSDLNWNGRADPAWSPDGTNVVYWQALVTAPACGGANPLPCPQSTEPGGRRTRLMIARLTSRKPIAVPPVAPIADVVPWATPYVPGMTIPARPSSAPEGHFTLVGQRGGQATVDVRKNAGGDVTSVSVSYRDFTNDGLHIISGTESAEHVGTGREGRIVWHSDLSSKGAQVGTKRSSEPGGFVASPSGQPLDGDLVTTIGTHSYRRPQPGT